MGEGVLLAFGRRSSPYWQDQKRMREEWVLVPTGEKEVEMGQLVGLAQTEPWLAATAAAHSSVHLSFLVVPFCFLHLDPIHRAACQSPYFIFTLFALLTSLLVKCLHSHPLYAFATSLSSSA